MTQPHNHRRHQSLQAVALHAWRLSSDPSKQEDFRKRLPHRSPGDDVSLPALWRIFAGWCAEHTMDPFQVTIPQLADFFMFLFHEKQLNPRTIKGYRSAISSTISACGSRTEFAHSAELASLIRSFQLERPPRRKVARQWNLSLVLQALVKPPFEPIAK